MKLPAIKHAGFSWEGGRYHLYQCYRHFAPSSKPAALAVQLSGSVRRRPPSAISSRSWKGGLEVGYSIEADMEPD